jgi:hypothetical protein
MKEGMVLIARVKSGVNDIKLFFGPFGVATLLDMHKAMPELKNITSDEEVVRQMGLKALGRSITNFTRLVDACI